MNTTDLGKLSAGGTGRRREEGWAGIFVMVLLQDRADEIREEGERLKNND